MTLNRCLQRHPSCYESAVRHFDQLREGDAMNYAVAVNSVLSLLLVVIGAPGQKPDQKPFDDAEFVKKAASGGMHEVELGKIAMTQAKNEDVKKFAEMMVTDHGKAGDELKKAAKEAGVNVPDKMSDEDQKEVDKFKDYKGTNFDQDYMKHMLSDHEKDVALFKRASKEAKNPKIKDFAAKTLPVVQAHLDQARKIQPK
jgi:putative membrane protein